MATTWALSFAKVEEKNAAAAELLRFCAFLAPEDIAVEMITQGAHHRGSQLESAASDPYELNQAIEVLRAYSLIQRDPNTGALSIHRLVQAVLQDVMNDEETKLWAEQTVLAVNAVFPDVKFEVWPQCERCLPHALVCAELVRQYNLHFKEAAQLLQKTGWYVAERDRYAEAEPLLEQALTMSEQVQGKEHLDTARDANTLGWLYNREGKYEQAEPLYVRALHIYEQQLGLEHSDTATGLNNLAFLYQNQGKYEQAEPLYVRALHIYEQQLGPEHPDTATSIINLAALYRTQGKYSEAEPLLKRALSIRKRQLGPEHPNMAHSLNNLALLYDNQGKYEKAEPLYQHALAIYEKALGLQHRNTQKVRQNYIALLQAMDRDEEAKQLEEDNES